MTISGHTHHSAGEAIRLASHGCNLEQNTSHGVATGNVSGSRLIVGPGQVTNRGFDGQQGCGFRDGNHSGAKVELKSNLVGRPGSMAQERLGNIMEQSGEG